MKRYTEIEKKASTVITKYSPLKIAVLLTLIVACDEGPHVMYETQFNVFAVIRNDKIKQEVFVDRTYQMDEPAEDYVNDALVILSGPGCTDTLEFSDSLLRYITTDTFTLQPLNVYRLSVIKTGFDTLFAETKIPGDYEFIFPSEGDTMTLEDTIIFIRNIGVSVYFCHFSTVISDKAWVIYFYYEPVETDSLTKIPLHDYLLGYPSGVYNMKFAALDSNFYKYYDGFEDSLIQAGVENGVGLFGSAWVGSIINYVITEED